MREFHVVNEVAPVKTIRWGSSSADRRATSSKNGRSRLPMKSVSSNAGSKTRATPGAPTERA